MKKPISILCISDLHFEGGDMSAINQLYVDYQDFVNSDKIENKRWHPNYVVVAGDVVNYNSNDYSTPQKAINTLITSFKIDPSHVIIVPGNHDKKIPKDECIRNLDKNKQVFMDYCDNTDNNKEAFGEAFYPKFEDYIKFCAPYFDSGGKDKQYEYLTTDILDDRLKYLTGIKVFNEDRLCFLIINTEWLYVSPKYFEKSIKKKVEKHLKISEKCKLCAPVIKNVCDTIKDKYPNYTVITVMHRGFDDLSWEENNVTDVLTVDAVSYIQDVSDVIFTGHDHTIHQASPVLIKNRIQHFKLGSVGRKEESTIEHIRKASIIRFYSSGNKIEMLHLTRKKVSVRECKWDIKPDDSIYPLYTKYDRVTAIKNKEYNCLVVKAKSLEDDDIQKAIETHFVIKDGMKVHYFKADKESLKKDLERVFETRCDEIPQYIIVYYIHHHDFVNYFLSKFIIAEIEKIIDEFRESHVDLFILNKLIVNRVIIKTPIFESIE